MARKKPPVTSSRRRQDRKAGKGAASKPSPRQTAAGGRGAQQGPLKPGTRTSGSGMVNANKPYMQRIQAKATELRQQTQRGKRPTGQRATTLPNSARAGRNLIREGAQRMRTPGDSGQVRAAAQRGQEIRKAAQAARGAKAAMGRMGGTLARARMMRAALALTNPMTAAAAGASALAAYGVSKGEVKRTKAAMPGKKANMPGGKTRKSAAPQKAGPAMPARLAKAPKAPKLPSANESTAKAFDRAFASARKAGQKTFTWRGKKYNTKLRGE